MTQGQVHESGGWWRTFHDKFVVEERFVTPSARRNLYRIAVALMIAGTALFVIILTGVLQQGGVAELDAPVRSWLLALRGEPLTAIMIFLAIIFGPIALPIIILVITVAWGFRAKHAWRPILLAGAMLTGVILAQIIGRTVDRQRPPVDLMLFGEDYTFSFPSGHVLGASDFLLVTAFLVFSRRRKSGAAVLAFAVAGIGIFLSAVSRLYLGYHWVTDTMASVSISLVVLGAVMALDTWRTVRTPGERITGTLSTEDASQG